jgi:hypothetical protein
MKIKASPRTGRISNAVAYVSRFGVCMRELVTPRDPKTPAQARMRTLFGAASQGFGLTLSEPQRERWVLAALAVPSTPSLGEYSNLSGQQLCTKINSTLQFLGQPPVAEPPLPVVFTPNPVGALSIVNDPPDGVRLLLNAGPAAEDLMLFGQPPCNAGRMKHRRVYYLGLAGPATNGQCDITTAYTARFGQPAPGQKVFILTCQTKNGWKAQDHVTSAIVPPKPLADEQQRNQATKPQEAPAAETPEPQAAPAGSNSSLPRAMYMGSTPEAPGVHTGQPLVHPVSIPGAPHVHGLRVALGRLARLAGARIRAGLGFRGSPALAGY